MRMFIAGCLFVAFVSSSAFAADPQKDKKGDPDKIICKADKTTGSAISERICKKRSEWEDEKFRAREIMDDRNQVGQQRQIPSGGGG